MKRYATLFALICMLSAFVGVAYSAGEQEKAATDAAAQWLALTDSGQRAGSWFQAASAFRGKTLRSQDNPAFTRTRSSAELRAALESLPTRYRFAAAINRMAS